MKDNMIPEKPLLNGAQIAIRTLERLGVKLALARRPVDESMNREELSPQTVLRASPAGQASAWRPAGPVPPTC